MRLTQLRDLIAVIDAGSIRAAARALRITSPVLTRSVRELEEELGVQIIERTVHGAVATPSGQAIIARARNVQSELGRIKEVSAQLAGGTAVLTFGVGPVGSTLLPAIVTAFRRTHPATEVRIMSSINPILMSQLREGRLEFVLGAVPRGKKVDAQLKARPLFTSDRVIVGRRGHPLAKAKSLQELINADWLVHSAPQEAEGLPNAWLEELFALNGLAPPRSVVRCTGIGYQYLQERTDLISTTTRWMLRRGIGHDRIEPFQAKYRAPASFASWPTHLIVRADSQLTPAAAAMVAAIKAEARKRAFSEKAGKEITTATDSKLPALTSAQFQRAPVRARRRES
jgi:LysR family transcriptional regulator of abg operon